MLEKTNEEIAKFKQFKMHKHTTSYYIGQMKEDELEDSEKADIIFATYAMASEGLDIPELNCVVLASPKTSVEQSTGRVLRQLDYEYQPIIVDIDDQIGYLQNQGRKRRDYYQSCKYSMDFFSVNNTTITPLEGVTHEKTKTFTKINFRASKDSEEIIYE